MDNEKFQELVLQQFQTIAGELKTLAEGQKTLENGQKHLTDRLTRVETVVARIENDHGAKLGALLDGYYQNTKILADHTERLDRIEEKITTHDIKISILDKAKSNKRKAK